MPPVIEVLAAAENDAAWWFAELRTPLLRYLASCGLASADGEEVVQDAFIALFDHLKQGKPRDNLRGWLFRVVHNLGLKRLQRGPALVELEEAEDPAPDPEWRAADRQRVARLRAVFRALPVQDQRCLALRAEGLRYREIAEVLGISLGSVAASMARSLDKLAKVDAR